MDQLQQQENEIQLFVRSLDVLKTAGDVLEANRTIATKCEMAGNFLLERISKEGMSDEMDDMAKEFINKTSTRVTEMNEARSPITQIISALAKKFPEQENRIDKKMVNTPAYKLQLKRNEWATHKALEAEKIRKAAALKENITKEKASYKGSLYMYLNDYVVDAITARKAKLKTYFDDSTLDDIDDRREQLRNAKLTIPDQQLWQPSIRYTYMSADDAIILRAEVLEESWPEMEQMYKEQMDLYRNLLVDQIETKRKTLLDLLKAQNDREKMLKLRQEEEEKQKQDQLKEQETANALKEKAVQQSNQITSRGVTQALFDTVITTSSLANAPSKPTHYDIILVKNPGSGYLMLVNAWMQEVGIKMTSEDLDKVKFSQIKKWAETKRLKDEFIIKSEFIQYNPGYKASNR